jgi:hypothetical protein
MQVTSQPGTNTATITITITIMIDHGRATPTITTPRASRATIGDHSHTEIRLTQVVIGLLFVINAFLVDWLFEKA